jgi:hypothetical protein
MTNRTNRRRISLQVSQPVRCCLKAVFVGGDDGEQGMCGHGEQGPALPGDPAADLVFVEPGQALAGLEGLLHGPPSAGDADQLA